MAHGTRKKTMSANLDLRDRTGSFAALERELFDILIIGAGITGSGIARDAAMRGFRVALVDAADLVTPCALAS